jgi:ATP-dependent Lon protease
MTEKKADDPQDPKPLSIDVPEDIEEEIPLGERSEKTEQRDASRITVPPILPILPIRDTVAFPRTITPITISREKSKRVLDLALAGSRIIAAVAQRRAQTEDPQLNDLYRVGTACLILKLYKLEDGSQTILVHGIARVGIETLTDETSYLEARVHPYYDNTKRSVEIDALVHNVRHGAMKIIEGTPNVPEEARVILESIETPGGIADFVAANLSLGLVHKQELLETFDVQQRLRKVYLSIAEQVDVIELSRKLQQEVRSQMGKTQREYFLREQLKAIRQELGEGDAKSVTETKLAEKIKSAEMPEEVEVEAYRELERMANIPQVSPEYGVAHDYIEWLSSMPWALASDEQQDIRKAERILEADHYGLDEIKKRILEYLAVRQLNPDGRSPILCFVGPPGVGKTSLGQSIARSLNREFIRIALGGVHDEADIRGHRRTYIGAVPGRIIQEIRKAKVNNPLIMFDEVDKLGQDFRGDPASALLEVLDPAQNHTFTDHYLDVPFSLRNVMFIATANWADPIPDPLLDRMEMLELSGYTMREKKRIAEQYLIPRQLSENGVKASQLMFDEAALEMIISGYTHEAGVRELERRIGALCRAKAAAIVWKKKASKKVTRAWIAEELGTPRYESTVADRKAVPGVVTGLAFTPVGGEILFVEASLMPGAANLNLTGQLGSVMRESSQAAFSIIRARAEQLGLDPAGILQHDYHIHVPAGAVPKDGPSAGVAMLTALISVLTDTPVDPATGMTGEITLRGRILPIGGVKEKVIAAHRAGLTRVILPKTNARDLRDIPDDIRQQIEFVFVQTIDELLKVALSPRLASKKSKSKAKARTKSKSKGTARKKTKRKTSKKRSKK